tara:strand:- start:30431 stop:30667 length:237 start_codon:yes stop_codon:yes gene_type:complete
MTDVRHCEHTVLCSKCGIVLCQYCIEDCAGCGMEGCKGCFSSHLQRCDECPGDFCPKEMKQVDGKTVCPMCKIGMELY